MNTNFMLDKLEAECDELILFIENDETLYNQRIIPIVKNVQRRLKRHDYDHDKAPKLWMYLVDAGAKKYHQEHCSNSSKWHQIFYKELRENTAKILADKYFEEIVTQGGKMFD
tara:strand:+ start:61 stop:399 length:339 start_codon:yes stop_codon:yes gene_type:complete